MKDAGSLSFLRVRLSVKGEILSKWREQEFRSQVSRGEAGAPASLLVDLRSAHLAGSETVSP